MITVTVNSRGKNEDYRWWPKDAYARRINKIAKSEMSKCLVVERNLSADFSVLIGGFTSTTRTDKTGTPIRDSLLFDKLKEKEARALAVLFFASPIIFHERLEQNIKLDNSSNGWRIKDTALLEEIVSIALEHPIQMSDDCDRSWWKACRFSESSSSTIADFLRKNSFPDTEGILVVYSKYLSSDDELDRLDKKAIFICSNAVTEEYSLPKKNSPPPEELAPLPVLVIDFPGNLLLKLLAILIPDLVRSLRAENHWLTKPRNLGMLSWILLVAFLILRATLSPSPTDHPKGQPEKKKSRRRRS